MSRALPVLLILSACGPEFTLRSPPRPAEPEPEPQIDEDLSPPEAVCGLDPAVVSPPHEPASFIGENSYDPDGLELISWRWRLRISPDGSELGLPITSGPNLIGFTPRVAGDYTATLEVINQFGSPSLPCDVTLEARPASGLHVEVLWTYEGDDMDLHLIRDDAGFRSDGDCHVGNCSPPTTLHWGDPALTDDDPTLQADDVDGIGPEIATIADPAAGTYTVLVHDHPASTRYADNPVTVNIWVDGDLAWSGTRTFIDENQKTAFALVRWPEGTIEAL